MNFEWVKDLDKGHGRYADTRMMTYSRATVRGECGTDIKSNSEKLEISR